MKKIIIIILLFLLWGFWQTVQAADLLLRYPVIAGEEVTTETTLPNLIKYIYLFALAAVGVVALLAMLIGAVKYVLSAGNPSKASDAKDQIFSAILGIILLLASVMILRIINPDLVNIGFRLPGISGGGGGPMVPTGYRCLCCCWTTTVCTPTSSIALVSPPTRWGTQDCRDISLSTATSECQSACSGDACNLCGDPARNITCKAVSKVDYCSGGGGGGGGRAD